MGADSTAKFDQFATMMSQMASILSTSQQESRYREDAIRDEIKSASATSAKDVSIVATQVTSMVSSIKVLEEQINTNADFSTDAFSQIR